MAKKQKIAAEEKVRIIRKCVSGEISVSEGAREAGADYESVRSWLNIYETQGIERFIWKKNRNYSPEEKEAGVLTKPKKPIGCRSSQPVFFGCHSTAVL